jgi:hypothetical protein
MSILITVCRINQYLEADNKILDKMLVEQIDHNQNFLCSVLQIE